jgi:hypothetical protein
MFAKPDAMIAEPLGLDGNLYGVFKSNDAVSTFENRCFIE